MPGKVSGCTAAIAALLYLACASAPAAAAGQGQIGISLSIAKSAAVKWYRRAAEQGDARAQYNLGLLYANGEGVPQDFVQAHLWYSLAATRGDTDAQNNRDIVTKRMTREQIAEAQRLARDWRPKAE